MPTTSNKMTGDFSGKPATVAMYTAIESYVTSLGAATKHLTAQVSFSVKGKFLWGWAYERAADGILFLNVRLTTPWRTRDSIVSARSVRTDGTTTWWPRPWKPRRASGSETSSAPDTSSPLDEFVSPVPGQHPQDLSAAIPPHSAVAVLERVDALEPVTANDPRLASAVPCLRIR